jgi:WD40 repeat protein
MPKCLPILAVLVAILVAQPAAKAAPEKGAPVAWQVQPDPYPWRMDAPSQPNKQVQLSGLHSLVFPTSPSPFVGVITPGNKNVQPQLTLYDLRRMEQVGQPIRHDQIKLAFVRVSPWGDHIAILDNKADRPTVWLWTVTGRKVVPSIVPHEGKEKIECCDFAGKDQIITAMEVDRKRTWRIWDVRTGKEVLSFDYPLEYHEKWMAFSPGRRYLAMQETHHLSYQLLFWDLRTGQLVGKIPMQDPKAPWGQCGNIAFTLDGKEAALLWYLNKDGVLAKIMRFDLERGTKVGELALGKEIQPSGPGFLAGGLRTLQFLPDGRGLLVSGHQIIERETGIPVWAIDPRPNHLGNTFNRRFLDVTHLTTQTADKKLKILTLPKAELDAAFSKVRSKAREGAN